jgi:hypothetical protein
VVIHDASALISSYSTAKTSWCKDLPSRIKRAERPLSDDMSLSSVLDVVGFHYSS